MNTGDRLPIAVKSQQPERGKRIMHLHAIDDARGKLIDLVYLCSDTCHRSWCAENGVEYDGWNGCNELEATDWCARCGVVIPGADACEHQLSNVVVNRIPRERGEQCAHEGGPRRTRRWEDRVIDHEAFIDGYIECAR